MKIYEIQNQIKTNLQKYDESATIKKVVTQAKKLINL